MTRYSIIIPTRNRAGLLRHAIASALNQMADDYEVIVSDNASSDDTPQVVRAIASPRLRYFRVDKALSMADHWEFVLGKASGDWVTYLCDDDALIPDCLASLDGLRARHPECRLIQFGSMVYVYEDGIASAGNYLRYPQPLPDREEMVDSRRQLRSVFATMSGRMPKFLNAAVRKDLVQEIRNRHGRVFHDWAPDYSSGVLLLAHTDRYLFAHRPLLIWGRNRLSYGSGAQADPRHLLTFLSEFGRFDGRFVSSPYPDLIAVSNSVYDTLHKTRAMLDDPKDDLVVSPRHLRRMLLRDVTLYVENGHTDYQRYKERLERDSSGAREWIAARLERAGRRASRLGRKLRDRFRGRTRRTRIIRGGPGGAGFQNVYEAACYVGAGLPSPPAEGAPRAIGASPGA